MVQSIEHFIAHWKGASGGERAQSQSFLAGLCRVLGLPEPKDGDYKFEYAVTGERGTDFIDLYKRGSFVLEAKQSRARGGAKAVDSQLDLLKPDGPEPRGRSSRAFDVLMLNARQQAENYARHLPAAHEWPPFIVVCDVGHCFELYADFTGKGRNYTQFPDRQGFRIVLDDLAKPEIRELLVKLWNDPHGLDPTKRAAKATRDIALRLAAVSRRMEARGENAEEVALFLMRCIFTMFAEDAKLLPEAAFTQLLEDCEKTPEIFPQLVSELWRAMDEGGIASSIRAKVKRFNGFLYNKRRVIPLGREEIGELRAAAKHDWQEVDPSIFGTLLEQALDPQERSRLGAHYTPRAYVERLVIATVIEPLRAEWNHVQGSLEVEPEQALERVKKFHQRLCDLRILDPACGTGNFLYVTLELLKRLEGEVLDLIEKLGGQEALRLESFTVDPHQFLGLEINPRAAAIAELVLWIGYLRWHLRTRGEPPIEPILREFKNIEKKDAVLEHDGVDVKGNYKNPRRPAWPEADYIVGNPPFTAGKDMRQEWGDEYTEALWAAHPEMNDSADFVMYWWDRAAELLARKNSILRRFGLISTNSITQVFSRRTVQRHMNGKPPIAILMAIPDHPWTKATKESAAVRIAMTVAAAGSHEGVLREVVSENDLDTDEPKLTFSERIGRINADLTVGVDVTQAVYSLAGEGLCSPGVKLHGFGFIVTPEEARHLGLGRRAGLERHIRLYRNGRDLTGTPRNVMVIDLFGLEIDEVRERFPEVYQHVKTEVKEKIVNEKGQEKKVGRDWNNRQSYRDYWWVFGEPRKDLRPAMKGLPRYIATVETAKHRIFQFLDAEILPDNMLVNIASADAFHLGVLSSRIHVTWALRAGGWLGVGNDPRYSKSRCFDPFPFPDPDPLTRARIADLAERLDRHRKEAQAAHPGITLTQMYNVLEKARGEGLTSRSDPHPGPPHKGEGEVSKSPSPLWGGARGGGLVVSPKFSSGERRIFDDALILILQELHGELDQAVAEAYGWPAELSDEEILARLVALNKERAAEEAKGKVRWLRPEYQIRRFGTPKEKQEQIEADLGAAPIVKAKAWFPAGAVEQTAAVMAALAASPSPLAALDIALSYKQGRKVEPRVKATLASLARTGFIAVHEGGRRFALPRAG